jgi:flagellar protein FliO/FliZ
VEYADFVRFIFSLALVIGLIWLSAYLFKRFGLDKKLSASRSAKGQLEVVDTLYLDARRRLVVVKHATREYVLLLAGDSATCIETRESTHES